MTIKYSDGPGNNFKNAIRIIDAKTEWLGIDSEYKLLSMLYAIIGLEWDLLLQELIINDNKAYDILVVKDSKGRVAEFYFDITGSSVNDKLFIDCCRYQEAQPIYSLTARSRIDIL
jgi:predicted RNA-binding protein associated with RNAse of E/G family